jgi:phosphoenolpyruvate phosphomutase
MKVILLNAGIGKRMGTLTESNPKCLVKITETDTILDYQLKNFLKCNLKNIIMLTGPFEDQIRTHVELNYPSLNVQYVQNPIYDKTNYIYTLYLVRNVINEDVVLVHGDLIFSDVILRNLINFKEKNCVLVNKEIPPPKKDFKALIIDERVVKIGVDVSGPNSAFLAPLYKLTDQFFRSWLDQINAFVNDNKVNCYAEDALNEILNQLNLKPFYINDLSCKEIDDLEDLNIIRKILLEKSKN